MRLARNVLYENVRTGPLELPDEYLAAAGEGRYAPALQDQIAIWVNEGGAGGEVVRSSDMPVAAAVDVICVRRTA